MKKYGFGVDIGGTTCKIGLFETTGQIIDKWEIPTDKAEEGKNILPNIAASLKTKMAEEGITANKMIIGGGSDANVLAGHGYKSVILGCGMINVHTVEEALDTDETWKVTKVLRRLMGAEQEMDDTDGKRRTEEEMSGRD